jgi:hypothetical protein
LAHRNPYPSIFMKELERGVEREREEGERKREGKRERGEGGRGREGGHDGGGASRVHPAAASAMKRVASGGTSARAPQTAC